MTTSKSSQESRLQAGANFTFEHLRANASFMPSIDGFAAFHISKQPTEQSTVRARLCFTPNLEKATQGTNTPGALGNPKAKPDDQAVC